VAESPGHSGIHDLGIRHSSPRQLMYSRRGILHCMPFRIRLNSQKVYPAIGSKPPLAVAFCFPLPLMSVPGLTLDVCPDPTQPSVSGLRAYVAAERATYRLMWRNRRGKLPRGARHTLALDR